MLPLPHTRLLDGATELKPMWWHIVVVWSFVHLILFFQHATHPSRDAEHPQKDVSQSIYNEICHFIQR
jgi:hypothetical protein